jgi:transcriptional regulator with XRE-family HTH domain
MNSGQKISRLIKQSGMTLTALSFESRIGHPNLTRIVRGRTLYPTPPTLKRIARALGVKWQDILGD